MDSDEEFTNETEKSSTKNTRDESTSTSVENLIDNTSILRAGSDTDSETEYFQQLRNDLDFDREVMENTLLNRRLMQSVDVSSIEMRGSLESPHSIVQSSSAIEPQNEEEAKKAERRKRLKKARNIRFSAEDPEIDLRYHDLEADPATSSSTQTHLSHLSSKESDELVQFFDGEDHEDDDEEEEDILTTPQGDTIKAKMEFLKFFEIPSLSDISEDTEEA